MSMLTGLYPSAHQVLKPTRGLSRKAPVLAELLAARGYQTAAVTEDGMMAAAVGFPRGFALYRELKEENPLKTSGRVDEVVTTALRWLAEHRNEIFFLFLHTYQVHGPYAPPPAFDIFTTYREDGEEVPITETTPDPIRNRHAYAGEVRYSDSELRRLFDGLDALGEANRTIVVVTSDHGEAFAWDHGFVGHGRSLAEEILHVPLILHAPGLVPAGVRVPVVVSLVDLAPTILDLIGVAAPPSMQGVSLVPLLHDPEAPGLSTRPIFSELSRERGKIAIAARRGGRKWIIHKGPGGVAGSRPGRVYDLRVDPTGQHNIATAELLAEGETLIDRHLAESRLVRAQLSDTEPTSATPDERTIEKMRALGYLE
jgi:arylsulfatase A-like enzyme